MNSHVYLLIWPMIVEKFFAAPFLNNQKQSRSYIAHRKAPTIATAGDDSRCSWFNCFRFNKNSAIYPWFDEIEIYSINVTVNFSLNSIFVQMSFFRQTPILKSTNLKHI